MDKLISRQGNSSRSKYCRPINCMETDNTLTNNMQSFGRIQPVFFVKITFWITESRQISCQRIKPNVHYLGWISRYRHAPTMSSLNGSGNTKVLKPAFDKRQNLVSSCRQCHLQLIRGN